MSDIHGAEHIDGRTRAAREARAQQGASGLSGAPAVEHSTEVAVEGPGGRRITRENRKPFGSQDQKLAYPDRQGFHRHWTNDEPGRIAGLLEAGYTHVKDPLTKENVSRVVGVARTGGPQTAFLLEIPEEWFRDDMAANEKINAEKEETIRRAQVQAKDRVDQERFYPTAQGRKMAVTRR